MSVKELDRVDIVRRVIERKLPQVKAAELMGLSARQVRRLCIAYQRAGPIGLASRKRGQPSNRRLPPQLQAEAVEIVRERYADFGPKLAQEKLLELHHIRVAKETLRKWMTLAGLWLPRDQRLRKAHQPRHRRAVLTPSSSATWRRRAAQGRRRRRAGPRGATGGGGRVARAPRAPCEAWRDPWASIGASRGRTAAKPGERSRVAWVPVSRDCADLLTCAEPC